MLLYEDTIRNASRVFLNSTHDEKVRLYNAEIRTCTKSRRLLPQPQSFGLSTLDICIHPPTGLLLRAEDFEERDNGWGWLGWMVTVI